MPRPGGKSIFLDGSFYEGLYQDGKPHGLGTMTYADGRAPQSGQWKTDGTTLTFLG